MRYAFLALTALSFIAASLTGGKEALAQLRRKVDHIVVIYREK